MGNECNFQGSIAIELSASRLDQFVKKFDYTDQEWGQIELSAQSVRTSPLTEEVRHCLREAATLYLTMSSTSQQFLKQQELASIENWARIRELAAELYELLDEAAARSADDRKYRRLLNSLTKLRDDASILSAKNPSLPAREDYYREVFRVWTDKLSGRLGLSRDADNKLGGPLVRFFQAVTRPVLRTEPPACESISRIVAREKERRKEQKRGRASARTDCQISPRGGT